AHSSTEARAQPIARHIKPQAALRAAAMLEVGVLPDPSPGVAVAFMLGAGPVRVELSPMCDFQQEIASTARPGAGGRLQLFAGSMRVALMYATRRVEAGPSLGIEVGAMRGEGYGVTDPVRTAAWWVASLGGGNVAWRVAGPFGLRLGIEGGAVLV